MKIFQTRSMILSLVIIAFCCSFAACKGEPFDDPGESSSSLESGEESADQSDDSEDSDVSNDATESSSSLESGEESAEQSDDSEDSDAGNDSTESSIGSSASAKSSIGSSVSAQSSSAFAGSSSAFVASSISAKSSSGSSASVQSSSGSSASAKSSIGSSASAKSSIGSSVSVGSSSVSATSSAASSKGSGSVSSAYSTPAKYFVTFMDADGSTVIGIQAVEGGGLAYEPSPPSLPALESLYYAVIPVNLNFDGWYLYKNAKWDFNTEITANITLTARWAEGGSFTMGSPSNEPDRYSDEARHFVTLTKGLYMGKYPVTQELYHAVMGTNPSHFSTANGRAPLSGESADKRPAEKVSWYDALVFCNTLSMLEGFSPVYNIHGSTDPSAWGEMPAGSTHPNCAAWNAASIINGADGYRLPTEAEWEYVCRAGTDTAYNTGETISNNTGWYSGNSGGSSVGTHEVGKKSANNWGFFDMSGNVKEWCWDWYGADYCAAADADRDPTGPASSDGDRVIRSGSWNMGAHSLRSAYRDYNYPWSKINSIGFRIARYPFAGLGNRSAP